MFDTLRNYLFQIAFKFLGTAAMNKVLARFMESILSHITPQLKAAICDAIRRWEIIARETATPWDDMLVKILKDVFYCD